MIMLNAVIMERRVSADKPTQSWGKTETSQMKSKARPDTTIQAFFQEIKTYS